MAILITCETCGKKLKVDEKRIGTAATCPGCKTRFTVPAPGSKGSVRMRTEREKGKAVAFDVNWVTIMWIAAAVIIVGGIAVIYFGPVTAKHQWDGMVGKVNETIEDVVQHGLAYEKQEEMKDFPEILKKMQPPSVIDVHCYWNAAVMSVPEYMEFTGTSTEGAFKGKYNTKTGEVSATADMGARVVANLMVASKGSKQIAITGRKKGEVMTVEVGGNRIP